MVSTAPISRCLHVGFPKTGSTALQLCFFTKHPEISAFCVRPMGGHAPNQPQIDQFIQRIVDFDRCMLDMRQEALFVERSIVPFSPATRCVLVSVEGFTWPSGIGIGGKSARLKRLFPDYRVVLVIRKPVDLLSSLYTQYFTNIDRRALEFAGQIYHAPSLDRWLRNALDRPHHAGSPAMLLHCNAVAQRYVELFGRDRVKVMLYEDLRTRPAAFIADLAQYLGIDGEASVALYAANAKDLNVRLQPAELVARGLRHDPAFAGVRSPERLLAIARGWVTKMGGESHFTHIDDETRDRLNAIAAPQCAAVAQEWQLDIARHGYPS